MKPVLLFILICKLFTLSAQDIKIETFDTLFDIPGFKAPSAEADLSASLRFEIRPDSICIDIDVTDDFVLEEAGQSDRVEIWFAAPDVDYSDYITGKSEGKTYIFRNSAEAGDQADLKRFFSNGDYPATTLETTDGKPAEMLVPQASALKRDLVFAGITHYTCFAGSNKPERADLDKYQAFEKQTGFKISAEGGMIKQKYTRTEKGYKINLRMPVEALGFMRMHNMRQLVTAIEIYDNDNDGSEQVCLSSAQHLYYARPWYFNKIELPFELKPNYPQKEYQLSGELGLIQDLVYTNSGWKLYGLSKGPIVYAKDHISEAGLMQYLFYPVTSAYSESSSGEAGMWRRLDLSYDDITIFEQHEVYIRLLGKTVSGKLPHYNHLSKDKFANRVFFSGDDTAYVSIYDYEAFDPLGFGEFGLAADEFYSVQRITRDGNVSVFSSGERILASGEINLGEKSGIIRSEVKSTTYTWIEPGKIFSVKVKYRDGSSAETFVFKLGTNGIFEKVSH